MNMLASLCALASMFPVSPAESRDADAPVVLWEIRFVYVADAGNESGDAVSHRDERGDVTMRAPAVGTTTPPSTTEGWPQWLALSDNRDSCDRAVVEIVDDDKSVQIEDLSFRLHPTGLALLRDGREVSPAREDRIRVSAAPRLRTFANGVGAEFCQTGPFDLSKHQATPKSHQLRKDWLQEGVYVSADFANGNAVSVQDLVIGRRVIGEGEKRASSPTGEWYPLLVEQRAGASLWLSPRQMAVVRLPRAANDRGSMTAFIKVLIADEKNTREFKTLLSAQNEPPTPAKIDLLPLVEKP